jgi:hypothetical protein
MGAPKIKNNEIKKLKMLKHKGVKTLKEGGFFLNIVSLKK